MASWFDSHCHIQGFDDPASAIARAVEAGVSRMVCVGVDVASSRAAVDLAWSHEAVSAAVGVHPHEASRFASERAGLEALVSEDGVVAVGETGLDHHYMNSPADAQEAAFRAQVALAKDAGLTLVVHTRDAWDETFRILEEEGPPDRVVFHCFTGGPAEADRALALGAWLSFSGIVTFPGADDVRAAAAAAPSERVLVETDSPYLAPVPHRGRPNEPAYTVHVGAAVAAARSCDPAEAALDTTAAATRAFGLAGSPD